MEENKNLDASTPNDRKKPWYLSTRGLAAFIVLTVILLYGGYSQINNSDKSYFTEYQPLSPDTLLQKLDTTPLVNEIELLDSSISMQDTVPINEVVTPVEETGLAVDSTKESSIKNLFKVNTNYEEIVPSSPTALEVEVEKASLLDGGLFEELLLPEGSDLRNDAAFYPYLKKDIISAKAVLKLISLAGKNLLLGNATTDDQEILEVLAESENIVNILLVDRKGKVVFSVANRKQINKFIVDILPKVNQTATTLSWYAEENQQVASFPLFHTYGKIGIAVLITK